jgi:hypothetical protein
MPRGAEPRLERSPIGERVKVGHPPARAVKTLLQSAHANEHHATRSAP